MRIKTALVLAFLLASVTTVFAQDHPPMVGSGESTIIYVMPHASERVKNPMAMKTAIASYYVSSSNPMQGKRLWEIFKLGEPNADKYEYEIIRVLRIYQSSTDSATYWFEYIEKKDVLSLEEAKKPLACSPPVEK